MLVATERLGRFGYVTVSNELTYFAKVENGIVTAVHVVSWDFLVANPDRYGDPSLWLQAFHDNSGRGYANRGYLYDADTDTFSPPPEPEVES